MAKVRSTAVDYLVYLVVRCSVCVLQMLTFRTAIWLADGLAWLAFRLDRRHREVALDNLRHAFPEKTDAERRAIVRGVYRHFCHMLMEIVHLPRLVHAHNWKDWVDLAAPGMKDHLAAILVGRPMLLVTGHFGNWEMEGYVLGLLGIRIAAVARPLDNPFVDRFLRRFRQATGQTILAKSGEFDLIRAVLARGGLLGTLADQDAGVRGQFVDFFGRPASTHKAIALLALEYKAALLVGGAARVGEPMYYRPYVEDVIFPEEYRGRTDAVRAITQRYTAALERMVRRHPEQYFWLHRRWKHRPAVRADRRVA